MLIIKENKILILKKEDDQQKVLRNLILKCRLKILNFKNYIKLQKYKIIKL